MLHQTLLLISCLSHSRLTIGLLLYVYCIRAKSYQNEDFVIDFLYNGQLFCVLQDACSH